MRAPLLIDAKFAGDDADAELGGAPGEGAPAGLVLEVEDDGRGDDEDADLGQAAVVVQAVADADVVPERGRRDPPCSAASPRRAP